MRFSIATLALLATPWAEAFTPTGLSIHRWPLTVSDTMTCPPRSSTSTSLYVSNVNVSVEFDAAAKLAYESWRKKYNKGPFDENKYRIFRTNYEATSVAHSTALKKARDSGSVDAVNAIELNESADSQLLQLAGLSTKSTESPTRSAYVQWCKKYNKTPNETRFVTFASNYLIMEDYARENNKEMILNRYADCTEEEYIAIMSRSVPTPKQTEENVSLAATTAKKASEEGVKGESAVTNTRNSGNAVVVNEDKRELEIPDSSNVSRIRPAYTQWCQKYNKTPDDSRFLTFVSNFLALEEYAKESNKEMILNRYADCTEEEYISIMSGPVTIPTITAVPASNVTVKAAAEVKAKEEPVVMMTKNTPRDSGTSSGIYTPTSSETRIRSAYTLWCGQYNKTPDESRFATFSSNYLVMEQYAKENGKEMILNRYADCTEEEYFSITSGSVTVPSKAAERQSSVTAPAKETEEVKIKESSAAKVVKIAENKKTEANAKPALNSKVSIELSQPPSAAKKVEVPKAPETIDIEKLKKLREQELEKAAAAANAAAEAEAITKAKALAEKEAAQIASRRQVEAEAAEKARYEARKAEAALEARNVVKTTLSIPTATTATEGSFFDLKDFFSFLYPSKPTSDRNPPVQKSSLPKIPKVEARIEDGNEPLPISSASDARIRSAYMEWCKKYDKTADESRFVTFSFNFLLMEDYARENNKEMILNRYADCTEEEYISITSGSAYVPSKAEDPLRTTVTASKVALEAKLEEKLVIGNTKTTETNKLANEMITNEIKSKPEPLKNPVAKQVEEPKEAESIESDKVKKLREKELEKASATAKAAAEAEAIAKAKALAEKEADQIAKRRRVEAEAAEKAREKARKAEAELEARRVSKGSQRSPQVSVTDEDSSFDLTGFFSFLKPSETRVSKPVEMQKSKPAISFFSKPTEVEKESSIKTAKRITKTSKQAGSAPVSENFLQALTSGTISLLPLKKSSVNDKAQIKAESKPVSGNFLQALSSGTISLQPLKKSTASEKVPTKVEQKPVSETFLKALTSGTISLRSLQKSTANDKVPTKVEQKPVSETFLQALATGTIPLGLLQTSRASDRTTPIPRDTELYKDPAYFQKALGFGTVSLRPLQKSTVNDKTPPPLKKVETKSVSENFLQVLASGTIPLLPLQKSSVSDRTPKLESKSPAALVNIQKAPLGSGSIPLRPLQKSTAIDRASSSSKKVEPKPDSENVLKSLASGTISLLPLQKSSARDRSPPQKTESKSISSPVNIKKPLSSGSISLRPLQKSTASEKIPSTTDSTDSGFQKALGLGTISLWPLQKTTASDKTPNLADFKPAPVSSQKPLGSGSIPLQRLQKSTANERISSAVDSADPEYFRKALGLGTISLRPPQKSTANDSNANKGKSKLTSSQNLLGSGSIPLQSLQKSTANERITKNAESKPDSENFLKTLASGTISLQAPQKSVATGKVPPKTRGLNPDSNYFQKSLGLNTVSLRPPQISATSGVSTPRSSLKDTVPTLKNWIYNFDGTITGTIMNSKKFLDGTDITTSPVKGVIKSGSVVVSNSGNKYRLM